VRLEKLNGTCLEAALSVREEKYHHSNITITGAVSASVPHENRKERLPTTLTRLWHVFTRSISRSERGLKSLSEWLPTGMDGKSVVRLDAVVLALSLCPFSLFLPFVSL